MHEELMCKDTFLNKGKSRPNATRLWWKLSRKIWPYFWVEWIRYEDGVGIQSYIQPVIRLPWFGGWRTQASNDKYIKFNLLGIAVSHGNASIKCTSMLSDFIHFWRVCWLIATFVFFVKLVEIYQPHTFVRVLSSVCVCVFVCAFFFEFKRNPMYRVVELIWCYIYICVATLSILSAFSVVYTFCLLGICRLTT